MRIPIVYKDPEHAHMLGDDESRQGLQPSTESWVSAVMEIAFQMACFALCQHGHMRLKKKKKKQKQKKKQAFTSFGEPTRLIACADHGNDVIRS